ncbi:hypothetical protein I3A86_24745 [Salmonella enterica]|nr:hypothetical protein [Salmonella enterica]
MGAADALDEGATLAGTEGASMDGASAATPAGIDGEIAKPLIEAKSKPRRWPTPIIDV